MEPLTALSVASNVVQFVDFATRIVTRTVKVYRAEAIGEEDEYYRLDKITRDLQKYNDALKISLQSQDLPQFTNVSSANKEIIRICGDCESITFKLLADLKELRGSKVTLWSSFLQALKTIWSDAEVQTLRQTLDSYRQQMSLYLLASLRFVRLSDFEILNNDKATENNP